MVLVIAHVKHTIAVGSSRGILNMSSLCLSTLRDG